MHYDDRAGRHPAPHHPHPAREAAETQVPPATTKAQRLSREKVFRYFAEESLTRDSMLDYYLRDQVPEAWHTLEYDLDVVEPKVKVTLRLDKSVAAFYRGMGHGYQARINRILALYAHLRISKFIEAERAMKEQWG